MSERCQPVLIVTEAVTRAGNAAAVADAVQAVSVASVIVPAWDLGDAAYIAWLKSLAETCQGAGAAVLAVDDTRAAGRAGCDGVHLTGNAQDIRELREARGDAWIIGCGASGRDDALLKGESGADYVFFGRIGGDTHPDAHRKNIDLAEWWSAMVELPCILAAGDDLATLGNAAASGCDFVALSRAVLDADEVAGAMANADALLADYPLTGVAA